MPAPKPHSQPTNRKTLITLLIVGCTIVFILGFVIASLLKMPLVDRVAFLFCLGIVNILAATFITAYLTRNESPNDDEPK